MKRKFEYKVLDREKKSGWLWDSYKITLRLVETGAVGTFSVTQQQYYDLPIGSEGKITLYRHSNNLWYPQSE